MLGKNFDELIDQNRLTSVGLMYELFLRIGPNAIQDLRDAFGNYIKVKQTSNILLSQKQDLRFMVVHW